MAKYKIRVNFCGEIQTVEVEGRKVKIPGYDGFEFFIHHSFMPSCMPIRFPQWTISEVSTGWAVAEGPYQRDVRTEAIKRMATVNPEKFQAMLEDCIQKAGKP